MISDIMTSKWPNFPITCLHLIFGSENVPADTFLGKGYVDCVYQSCLDVTALQNTKQQYYGCGVMRRKWKYLNTVTESMDYPVIPSYDRTISTSTCNTPIWAVTFTEVLYMTVTWNLGLGQFQSCILCPYMRQLMVCYEIQM